MSIAARARRSAAVALVGAILSVALAAGAGGDGDVGSPVPGATVTPAAAGPGLLTEDPWPFSGT